MAKKNLEPIKSAIISAHRRGLCDSDGNSSVDRYGMLTQKPRGMTSHAKTYVVRNGKCVEKN